MKALVETTGDFMLFNAADGAVVESHRPTILECGNFLQYQMGLEHIRILLAELPDEATDAEWVSFMAASDGDLELAMASFASKFQEPADDGAGKGKGKGTGKAEPSQEG